MVTSVVAQLSIRYVNATALTPTAPYTSWATAATNIQDAIDVAVDGDLVLVTNGVYAAGGKVMFGDLTNRVALDKAITVQSVNGPWVTTIRGAGAINGPVAVRCAWLTNGATLYGFTLAAGATRTTGDAFALRSGGGGWCASTNAIVANCIIRSNTASSYGGGFFQGTLRNSYVVTNQISPITGGAVANAKVISCTVVSNLCFGVMQTTANLTWVTNSIVYHNIQDYSGGTFAYTCAYPLASGAGNISNAPLFQVDGLHLSAASPCRGVGTSVVTGTDLFGQSWGSPPSMGCVEWNPLPVVERQPLLTLTNNPGGFAISFKSDGQPPLTYYWYRDDALLTDDGHFNGTATTNLFVRKIRDTDAGNYSVVVSNSFGTSTSQVVSVAIHFVDAAGINPVPPYTSWASAATSTQDAIDVAAAGHFVLVTNGIYASGGKVMAGDLLNRVAIDKAITVLSVNGYRDTIIEGAWDPISTNGPAAVRGVWMTNQAVFIGFTVRNGATRGGNSLFHEEHSGGGIWAVSTNAMIINCSLTNNVARYGGGGSYQGSVRNTILTRNKALLYGGGAYNSELRNCTVFYNDCNSGISGGAGTYGGQVRNSIVLQNFYNFFGVNESLANYFGTTFQSSYSYPKPSGVGNLSGVTSTIDFVDAEFHLPLQSPCRGTGSALYTSGEDLDGEAWADPPSMGADEVIEANLAGPISLSLNVWPTNVLVSGSPITGTMRYVSLWDSITGRVSRIAWDFGDGFVVTNGSYHAGRAWVNPGSYTVTSTAYNTDNPDGVSASVVVNVLPLLAPTNHSVLAGSNGFKFSFEAQESARYTIQYATNLAAPITWRTLQTIYSSPGGTTQFTDPALTNTARFYRVFAQ